MNYRDEVQKYRKEENWVKDQNDYFKAREQDLLEREENHTQREADIAKRELKTLTKVKLYRLFHHTPLLSSDHWTFPKPYFRGCFRKA